MIEQVIVIMVISFSILAWLLVLRITTRGVVVTRDSLEAQTLAAQKMEDLRNAAVNAAMSGMSDQQTTSWQKVTLSPLALEYGFGPGKNPAIPEFNYLTKGARVYQWRVMSDFCVGVTATGQLKITPCVSNFISFTAEVFWPDPQGPAGVLKAVTITGFAVNYKYNAF